MNQRLRALILLLDSLWIVTAFALAYALRHANIPVVSGAQDSFAGYLPAIEAALAIWIVLFFSKSLEGFRGGWHIPTVFSQIAVGAFYLMLSLFAVAFLGKHDYSRLLLLYVSCLLPLGFVLIRSIVHSAIVSRSRAGASRRAVIIGGGHLATELASKIARHPELLIEIVGLVYPAGSESSTVSTGTPESALSLSPLNVLQLLQEKNVQEIIVVMPQPAGPECEKLIAKCREAEMRVRLVPQWYELYVSDAQMVEIDGVPLISLDERNIPPLALALKRVVDIFGALLLLTLTSPILLLGFFQLHRKRPHVLSQYLRCGLSGKTFSMLRLNVDRNVLDLTRFEKALVSLSLTELPQLWNVLRGEMSLVGPRPEPPERVKHYSDWQRQRLSVKPGLTGLAQVHGLREQHSSAEKARFDLQYIFHWSLFLDFSLILQTAWTVSVRLLKPRKSDFAPLAETPDRAQFLVPEVVHADSSQPSAD